MTEKISKRLLSLFTALAVTFVLTDLSVFQLDASAEGTAKGINVPYRTQEEITDYVESLNYDVYADTEYDREPVTAAPYDPGKLSADTLENALKVLNAVRFTAGLDEVGLSDEYNELAQAGALVNAVNDQLSHFPEQPADMPDELFEKCNQGTGSSNLGMGYKNLADDIIRGWMVDKSAGNIDRLGHRRWCLNPTMKLTGFGQVNRYMAMYSFDNWFEDTDISGVCWPAQNTPVQYFNYDYPWSISMGYQVNPETVKVTLTRISDGTEWTFSQSSADGDFYVDNANYGQVGCIIFRPSDFKINAGDEYNIKIDGLNDEVEYNVNFFDLEGNTEPPAETTTTTTETTTTTTAAETTTTTTAITTTTTEEITTAAESEEETTPPATTTTITTTTTAEDETTVPETTTSEETTTMIPVTTTDAETEISTSAPALTSTFPQITVVITSYVTVVTTEPPATTTVISTSEEPETSVSLTETPAVIETTLITTITTALETEQTEQTEPVTVTTVPVTEATEIQPETTATVPVTEETTEPIETTGTAADYEETTTIPPEETPDVSTSVTTIPAPDGLPQTGNNSAYNLAIALTALMLTVTGAFAVKKSKIHIR